MKFDMEIWKIFEAIKIAKQKCLKVQQPFIISIFCDLQYTIKTS